MCGGQHVGQLSQQCKGCCSRTHVLWGDILGTRLYSLLSCCPSFPQRLCIGRDMMLHVACLMPCRGQCLPLTRFSWSGCARLPTSVQLQCYAF